MQVFEKEKSALEFEKVLLYIADKCVSGTGRARLLNSPLLFNKAELEGIFREIHEMREVYEADGGFPIWDFADIRVLLNKIEPAESYLAVEDFLKLMNFLELVSEILQFSKKYREKYPLLVSLIKGLSAAEKLLSQLQYTFEPSGKLFDNASPELKQIRREMGRVDNEVHIHMERVLRKYADHVQEEYITLRDGRLVVPVREFSVNKVPGIVHGQSSSGATYFVEPMPVIELNNQMQKLHAAESKEIIRILKRISAQVRELQPELLQNLHVLNELDVLQAKARYANEFDCVSAQINNNFIFEIKAARHPLLLIMQHQPVVPLDLQVGGRFNELLISGPNAGGKTVALKTVGLLQLLFQSGFHIPAAEGTALPLCRKIFTVIGDEQSLENDLSTFSSHIHSLKEIVENVEKESLILIDEIGSGTEPSGGAALAIALLEALNREELVTIATTHQNQLKVYAAETQGMENAAMQFDTEKLSPMFRLESGLPGSSYTFEICRRLGLDERIIDRAVNLAGSDSFELDALLTEAQDKSREYGEKLQEISIKESELAGLLSLYNARNKELKNKKKDFEKQAKAEAQQILLDVNKEIEAVIREIRESHADKQAIKAGRRRIEKLKEKLQPKEEQKALVFKADDFKTGQRARSLRYDVKGKITKVFKNKKEVEIEKDGLKLTVPMAEVEILDEHGQVVSVHASASSGEPVAGVNVPGELDLRGLTVDEALRKTEIYLDSALMSSWSEVRLVHGKGTGALRQAVHQYLAKQKRIKEYRLGRYGEGDTGVTVVTLTEQGRK